jgi:hypothetical protein
MVRNAVRAMFVRAGLSILAAVAVVATRDTLTQQLRDRQPNVSTVNLDLLVNITVGAGVVFGLVYVVLYALLAVQVGKGKRWARTLTVILAILGILGALRSVAQPVTGLNAALAALDALLDIGILVLLTRPSSREFFPKIR